VRYPSLASLVIKSHMRRQAVAEEIRVLYVALTRAREHLILVGSSKSTYDEIRDEWADHEGPLPDEAIHQARTALDWVAPIAAITERRGLGTFIVKDWNGQPLPSPPAATGSESTQVKLKRWFEASSKSNVELSEVGQAAIDRLRFVYPHLPSTLVRSTSRISDLITAPDSTTGERRALQLEWPASYRPRQHASALEIGSATHRFMELFDPARIGSKDEILEQVQSFVARRLLDEKDAKLVNVDIVQWFASTDLNALMRDPRVRLMREQSIAFSVHQEGLPESDCALVRGRIDALLDTPEGLVLLDYKTDRVEPLFVAARAESYWPQVKGYARAVQSVVKRPVVRASLVFLHARQIIDLPAHLLASDA
jgi:ATP-dependent helicase/nuclease subunit A